MIVVHHLNNSRSHRVLWLLEELGIEYEIKYYERDAKTMLAPESLRQVHPLGKSPVITDARIVFDHFGTANSGVNSAFIAPQIKLHFDYIEGELHKSTWFAGEELTAADIQMSFPLEMIAMLPEQVESRPKLKEFVDRIHARPAYKQAIERGGRYENFFVTEQSS